MKLNLMSVWLILIPVTFVLLVMLRSTPTLQFQLICLSALIYIGLALLHHKRDKSLSLEVILEYLLISILGLIILLSTRF